MTRSDKECHITVIHVQRIVLLHVKPRLRHDFRCYLEDVSILRVSGLSINQISASNLNIILTPKKICCIAI